MTCMRVSNRANMRGRHAVLLCRSGADTPTGVTVLFSTTPDVVGCRVGPLLTVDGKLALELADDDCSDVVLED